MTEESTREADVKAEGQKTPSGAKKMSDKEAKKVVGGVVGVPVGSNPTSPTEVEMDPVAPPGTLTENDIR